MIGTDTLLCVHLPSQAVEGGWLGARPVREGEPPGAGQKQATAFRVKMHLDVALEQKRRRIRGQRGENDQMVLSCHKSSEKNN